MSVEARGDAEADGGGVGDGHFVAVRECRPAGRTDGETFDIRLDIGRAYGSAGLFVGFKSPLLDGIVDQCEILDASGSAGLFAGSDVIRNRDAGQDSN